MKILTFLIFCCFLKASEAGDYINPITKKMKAGVLQQHIGKLEQIKILGNSRFAVPNSAWSARYSPDGDYVVIGGYNYVGCFEQKTGERVWGRFLVNEPKYRVGNPVRAVEIDKKHQYVLVGCDYGLVQLLDFKSGELVREFTTNSDWIMAAAFSNDSKYAASIDIKGIYHVWNVKNGEALPLPRTDASRGESIQFSPDNKKLAIGLDNALMLINLKDQTAERVATPGTVQSIAFLSDNKSILISGWGGFVKMLDLSDLNELWSSSIQDWLINLRVLPDNSGALLISPFSVYHLDLKDRSLKDLDINVRTAMDVHPDGRTILTLGQFANRINQQEWKSKETKNSHNYFAAPPSELSFSPKGNYLAAGSYFCADKILFWTTEKFDLLGSIEGQAHHGFERFGFTDDNLNFNFTYRSNNARIPIEKQATHYSLPNLKPNTSNRSKVTPFLHTSTNLESILTVHLKKLLPVRIEAFFEKLDDSMNRHLFGGWTRDERYFAGVSNENILYIYDAKDGRKLAGAVLDDFVVVACVIHPTAKMVAVSSWDGLIYIYRWDEMN